MRGGGAAVTRTSKDHILKRFVLSLRLPQKSLAESTRVFKGETLLRTGPIISVAFENSHGERAERFRIRSEVFQRCGRVSSAIMTPRLQRGHLSPSGATNTSRRHNAKTQHPRAVTINHHYHLDSQPSPQPQHNTPVITSNTARPALLPP
ncbi:hypothetical protein E2C01_090034 [Portunus trituberculatus]|uniref:Uncharacterized protein n=1 Tax=Portunus trituberculatus TaxID=210409 RepID=A0A5B7JKU7_PORTR|nr:hypothetical protein [Portunus trituberculatus]